jgi:hypothetical protein
VSNRAVAPHKTEVDDVDFSGDDKKSLNSRLLHKETTAPISATNSINKSDADMENVAILRGTIKISMVIDDPRSMDFSNIETYNHRLNLAVISQNALSLVSFRSTVIIVGFLSFDSFDSSLKYLWLMLRET